jgi:hypothetical protein
LKLLWFLIILFPFNLRGQILPVDAATGKIYYTDEVLIKDGPKTDLYNRAKVWFAGVKNKKPLIQDDLENGLLIGTNFTILSVSDGNQPQKFKLGYTLKIELADDRYFYRISDLTLQPLPAANKLKPEPMIPLETLIFSEKTAPLKPANKRFRENLARETHACVLALIKDLHTHML